MKNGIEWNGMECKILPTAIAILLDAMDKTNLHVSSGIKGSKAHTNFINIGNYQINVMRCLLSVYGVQRCTFLAGFRLFSHVCCHLYMLLFCAVTAVPTLLLDIFVCSSHIA